MEWTAIMVATVTGGLTLLGVVITQRGKRDERRTDRTHTLETRMDTLEAKLDEVRRDLRREQRFSHKMVLMLTRVLYYLRDAAAYRMRHAEDLPGDPPPLPDVAEIENLLTERPTYRSRDEY